MNKRVNLKPGMKFHDGESEVCIVQNVDRDQNLLTIMTYNIPDSPEKEVCNLCRIEKYIEDGILYMSDELDWILFDYNSVIGQRPIRSNVKLPMDNHYIKIFNQEAKIFVDFENIGHRLSNGEMGVVCIRLSIPCKGKELETIYDPDKKKFITIHENITRVFTRRFKNLGSKVRIKWYNKYRSLFPNQRAWNQFKKYVEQKAYKSKEKDCFEVLTEIERNWVTELLKELSTEFRPTDNYRVARMDSSSQMRRYKKLRSKGCCGFFDQVYELKGKKYLLGFNYGH